MTDCEAYEEDPEAKKRVCPNILSLAQYLSESGVDDNIPIVTWDDGELSMIECEFVDNVLTIGAAQLSSKNVHSALGYKLAHVIVDVEVKELASVVVVEKEKWEKIIKIVLEIMSI
jgi:hypothetical protein